jgi:prepilin peptidase CpaA
MDPFLGCALGVAAVGCATDLKLGKIPNSLTLPVLALAPLARMAFASRLGAAHDDVLLEGAYSVLGALVAAVVPLTLYRKSAIGAGDVKLFAALGALAQPSLGLEILSWAFGIALLVAPVSLLYQGKLLSTLKNVGTLALNSVRPPSGQREIAAETMSWFKLGPAILLATLLTLVLHAKDSLGDGS